MADSAGAESVEIEVLRASTGPVVQAGEQLYVWYAGELLDGTPFDANYNFGTFELVPGRSYFDFTLGSGQVIKGWDQALAGRRLGEILQLTIPSALAYGSVSRPKIPANSDLRFTVELLASRPAGASTLTSATFPEIGADLRNLIAPLADMAGQKVGSDRFDVLTGAEQRDLLVGLAGDDQLSGLADADQLIGGSGNDLLAGGDGNDLLDGGTGDDRILGGGGQDRLVGGDGADRFLFTQASDAPRPAKGSTSRELIIDFDGLAGDRIDLSALTIAPLKRKGKGKGKGTPTSTARPNWQFIGANGFSGSPGEVRFSGGLLQINTDSKRTADLEIGLVGLAQFDPGWLSPRPTL